MRVDVLATGSTGNAVLISRRILVDIGVPYKTIEPYTAPVRLVLLTHCHSDHWQTSTARALYRARPGLRWGCCEWMIPKLAEAGIPPGRIDLYQPEKTYDYGVFKIRAEPVPHNVPNTGYHIYVGTERCFYATDCSSLEHVDAAGYDLLLVEGNHGEDEIRQRIAEKQAAGEYAYEVNAIRNHLSRERALDWIARQAGPNTEYMLLHEHVEKTDKRE